jgi:hypothetical protein
MHIKEDCVKTQEEEQPSTSQEQKNPTLLTPLSLASNLQNSVGKTLLLFKPPILQNLLKAVLAI